MSNIKNLGKNRLIIVLRLAYRRAQEQYKLLVVTLIQTVPLYF